MSVDLSFVITRVLVIVASFRNSNTDDNFYDYYGIVHVHIIVTGIDMRFFLYPLSIRDDSIRYFHWQYHVDTVLVLFSPVVLA